MITLPRRRKIGTTLVAGVLLFAIANLVMAGLVARYGESLLITRISLDGEGTLPAYFSALLLLTAGLLLALQGAVARRTGNPMAWRWLVLSLVVLYLSIDEAGGLHEELGRHFGRLLPDEGLPRNTWVFLGAAYAAVAAVIGFPLLRQMSTTARWSLVAAGLLFLAGAIGVELLAEPFALSTDFQGPFYLLLVTVEETLEMSAVVVVILTLYGQLSGRGRISVVVP